MVFKFAGIGSQTPCEGHDKSLNWEVWMTKFKHTASNTQVGKHKSNLRRPIADDNIATIDRKELWVCEGGGV